jgi:LPXTG-motif cell wall-anchored protein
MNAPENRSGRVLTRLAAITAAAGLGALGFAAPASAQAPEPIETFLGFEGPFGAEEDPHLQGFEAYFGDDFISGEHTVSMSLSIDVGDDVFKFSGGDLDGRCAVNSTHTEVDCIQDEAPSGIRFEFEVEVPDAANVGSYPYTLELAVDGEVVHTEENEVAIVPPSGADELWPYAHGDVELTDVAPGSTVEVWPEFLQEDPIPASTEAVVLDFGSSEYGSVASAVADYDNCTSGYRITCAVTDFPDAPGTVYNPSKAVTYAIDEDAPGPFRVCACTYSVYPVDAETYGNMFGDLEWDENSDNLMGLRAVSEPESEFGSENWGLIKIETAENPVDLSVEDVNIKGAKGTESTIKFEYTNAGPADTLTPDEGPGSFVILGSLPTGVELLSDEDPEWTCFEPVDWDDYLPEIDPAALEGLDFACDPAGLASGESRTFELKVAITGSGSASDGTLAVVLQKDGVADTDLTNNIAKFTLNAAGSAQLPKTGSSLTLIIGIAALVVVAGVVLMVLTARRRKATTDE